VGAPVELRRIRGRNPFWQDHRPFVLQPVMRESFAPTYSISIGEHGERQPNQTRRGGTVLNNNDGSRKNRIGGVKHAGNSKYLKKVVRGRKKAKAAKAARKKNRR